MRSKCLLPKLFIKPISPKISSISIFLLLFMLVISILTSPTLGWSSVPGSGNALSLDGNNDYIDLPDGVWFEGDFTIESWIYLRSYASWCRLFDFGGGESSDNIVLAISNETSGKPALHIYNGDTYTGVDSSEQIPLNQWVHIAATASGTVGKIYINGRLVGINHSMNQALNVERTNAYIGKSNWEANPTTNMIIDEFRIWSVARTESEIRQNMCQKLSGTETGLLAYYRFDHSSGTTLLDLSANQLNGTLTNMDNSDWTTSTAPIGDVSAYVYTSRALNFDGMDDYVDLGNRSELILGNVFTMEAWIYSTVADANYYGFIGNQAGAQQYDRSPSLWVYNQTQIHYDLYNESNTSCGEHSGNIVPSNQWVHIALVHDGTTLNLYANGISQYTSTSCSGFDLKDIPINFIGQVDNYFSGSIDEVRLWNIARTASQIQNNMNARLTGNETGLVAYYRFDSTNGNTLYDFSGNEYHGSLNNMADEDWILSDVPFFDSEISVTINKGARIKAKGNGGVINTIHLYAVNEAPNHTDNPSGWQAMDTSHYFGVFSEGSSQAYSITYDYSNHSDISTETNFKLAYRLNATDSSWTDINATVNGNQNTLTKTNILYDTATEFIFGFYHDPPEMSTISHQASTNNTIGFTVTNDTDSQLTITVSSSDSAIISYTGLCLAGSGSYTQILSVTANIAENLTLTLTPMANQHERITVTILAENSDGSTSSTDFSVIVSPPGSGNALDFDGIGDYIDLPDGVWFNGDFTVESWIYLRSYNNWSRLMDFAAGADTGADNILIVASVETTGKPSFSIYNGSTNTFIDSPEQIPLNQWTHLAATSSGTVAKLYINGRLVGSNTSMNQALNVVRPYAYIGKSNWSTNAYANMKIDEFRIWNVARTESEIRQNMCQKLSGTETGILAYYRFDHQSGTTVIDLSGNQLHGTLTNMDNSDWTTSTAPIGDVSAYVYTSRALNFDGMDDYVDLGNRSELILGNVFTMEAWIYSTVADANYYGFIGNQAGAQQYDRSPSLWVYNQTQIHYDLYNESNTSCGEHSGNIVPSNQWVHIALVHDGTTLNLYANGISQYTSTSCSGFDLKDIPINFIGQVDNYFSGSIDEVRLWNIARTASQIQNNMNARLTGNKTGLVAYYRFDSTNGNTLYDFSGNEYHGSLNNMADEDWVFSDVPFFDSEISVTINKGATIKAKGNGGVINTIHLYAVNEAPNHTDNPSGWQAMDTSHYFGVFSEGSSQAYSITYDYSNHSDISTETNFKLAYRHNATDSSWTDINASIKGRK
jgi:uncharacterized membrane protein